jgi:hypothetical protein
MEWWQRKGAAPVDLPATRFAERSDRTGQLAWEELPPGHVLLGLIDARSGQPLVRVVTRAASPAELARFEHPRMPVVLRPSHVTPPFDLGLAPPEPDLFG